MDNRPVGLLWDSVSDNTGDQAVGLVMRSFLDRRAIPYEELNPYAYDPGRYSTIIIGGGELLQSTGNPFYDRFRVSGRHILNTVGVGKPDACEYLNDYRLVTVRSQTERRLLQQFVPNVEAVPCVTMLMGDYFPSPQQADLDEVTNRDTIGIHFHYGLVAAFPRLFALLKKLSARYKLEFIPFTQYNGDASIMEKLCSRLPYTELSTASDPAAKFHAVGRLRALVCTSLHAAMFAYAQRIPVLAYPYVPKVRYFFEERALGDCLFNDEEELDLKLNNLESTQSDHSASVEADRKTVRTHLDNVAEVIARARQDSEPQPAAAEADCLRGRAARSQHELTMRYELTTGQLYAEVLDLRLQVQENLNEYEIQRLQWEKQMAQKRFSSRRALAKAARKVQLLGSGAGDAIHAGSASQLIDLARIDGQRLQRQPYGWAFVDNLFSPVAARTLVKTFPRDNYKTVKGGDNEKDWDYEARSLIHMGAAAPSHPKGLSRAWKQLAAELISPAYRASMSRLTGLDLTKSPIEVNVFYYGPGSWLGPHVDLKDKIATHIFYFNQEWNEEDGGCLAILRSQDMADSAALVSPIAGNSAVLVRSENSWHGVSQVRAGCRRSRRSMTVTFYSPGSISSMWPPGDTSPLHMYRPAVVP
jgi:SM-20-related protein